MKKDIVLFHGDFDGIASAVMLVNLFEIANYEAYPCEPFGVNKFSGSIEALVKGGGLSGRIFIADLAPNNKCIKMTEKFLARCAADFNETVLYDHHYGWENIAAPETIKMHVDASYKSCAAMIYNKFGGPRNVFLDKLAADADIIDSGGCEGAAKEAQIIYRALKSGLKDDEIKNRSLEYMLSGYSDGRCLEFLTAKAAEYDQILKLSMEFAEKKITELSDGVCFIDVGESRCDITALIMRCYEKYDFVIVEYQSGPARFDVIGTRLAKVDLVKVFGLKSGAKFRVTITRKKPEEILRLIKAT